MEIINMQGTDTTPEIKFDAGTGKLEIRGRSVPEAPREFYKPLLDSIDKYLANPVSPTWVTVQMDYFNTTSSKCLLDIFRLLKKIHTKGSQVIIDWHYSKEDEDMKEAGEGYQHIVNLTFNMLEE